MASLTRLALQYPRAAALIVLLITIGAGVGLPRTWTNVGYRVFLGPEHPAIESLDRLIDRFGGGLPVLIAWECGEGHPCSHALDERSVRMADAVEAALLEHPLIRQVASPSSAEIVVPTTEGFDVRRLLEDGQTPPDAVELIERARADPIWRRTLVSDDGAVGAVVVQLASSEGNATAEVVPYLRSVLASPPAAEFTFYLVGDPIDFVVSGGQMQADTPKVMVALVGALVLTGWMLLRSFWAVALSLSVAGVSLVWAMGAMAWLGWPEMELTQALRPGILVVAVCDAIHLISRYAERSAQAEDDRTRDRRSTMMEAARDVQTACFLTSATTAIGFLSFTTSGSEAFVRFGIIAALGVMSALLLTFTALPLAMLALSPERLHSAAAQLSWRAAFERLNRFTRLRTRSILTVSTILILAFGVGISMLRVDLDERELFGEDSQVVQWASFVEDRLRRSDSLEILLRAPAGVSIIEPSSLAIIAEVDRSIESAPAIGDGRSIVDLLGTLSEAFHGQDVPEVPLEPTLESNAELLLLLEMGGGAAAGSWVLDDHEARLSFEADPLSTSKRLETINEINAKIRDLLPPGWSFEVSGPFSVYLAFADVIHQTQLWSFATALFAITGVLLVHLRRTTRSDMEAVRFTLVVLIPSLMPVVVTLGAMGFLDVPLDVGTAMVGAIIIGIAVDDSIHLITAFQKNRRAGLTDADSIGEAMLQTGQALVTSSIALSAGFFALMLSSWQSIASFGLLSGLAILAALISDLFVLPAIVLAMSRTERNRPSDESPVTGIPDVATRTAITAVCATIAAAATWSMHGSRHDSVDSTRLPCEVHRSGSVAPYSTISADCPLRAGDVVRSVAFGERRFEPREIDWKSEHRSPDSTPVFTIDRPGERQIRVQSEPGTQASLDPVVAWLLLGIAFAASLMVVWLSSAQAALPYGIWGTSLGSLGALLTVSQQSGATVVPFALALGAMSAASLQLSLIFPRRSRLIEDLPGLSWGLYLYGLALFGSILWGNARHPAIWRIAIGLAIASFFVPVARILIGLISTYSGSDLLDSRRARSAALGGGLILLVIAACAIGGRPLDHFVAFTAIAIPLPVGFALIRFQHFASRTWLRTVSEGLLNALLYIPVMLLLLMSSGASIAADSKSVTGRVVALAMMGVLLAIAIQRIVRMAMASLLPDHIEDLRIRESRLADKLEAAPDEHAVAGTLATAVAEGVEASGTSVALLRNGTLSLIAAYGDHPVGPSDMKPMRDSLESCRELLHSGPEGGATDWRRILLVRDHLSVACPIRWRGSLIGAVFVGHAVDRSSYSSDALAFIVRASRLAAAVLRNVEQRTTQASIDRGTTLDWVGAGLMHSVGKPLTIAVRTTDHLLSTRTSDEEVLALARIVRTAADAAMSGIAVLRRRAGHGSDGDPWIVPLEEIANRALDQARQLHAGRQIASRFAADLPAVPHAEEIRRILTNLLDNALLATPESSTPPEVRIAARSHWVSIDVVDHGVGMPPEILRRATEAFFTTRRASGGSGIGLLDVKSTVERLGGEFTLESTPGRGTVASMRLPFARSMEHSSADESASRIGSIEAAPR